MEKEKLLKDFESEFEEKKKKFKIKVSLEEIDQIFLIRDLILHIGFIGNNLLWQIGSRIAEVYGGWNNYLHSLIMPNPQNLINMNESKIFNPNEKKSITNLISLIASFTSKGQLVNLKRDEKEYGKFIDEGVTLWKEKVLKELIKIAEKINREWSR
jgi:hypothetical protein